MAPNKIECEWFHKLTLFVTLPNPTNYFLWMAHCRWSSLFVRAREKKKKHQVFVWKVMWMVKWVLSPEWFYFWGEKSSKILCLKDTNMKNWFKMLCLKVININWQIDPKWRVLRSQITLPYGGAMSLTFESHMHEG